MKALYYEEHGTSSVLKIGDLPLPAIGDKEVLIETRAAGLNPVDIKLREGNKRGQWPQQLPTVVGLDVAGVVVQVGPGCERLKVGDEVYSYNRPAFDIAEIAGAEGSIGMGGCCAEFVKVAEWKVALKPKSIGFSEAGGVPVAALTAYQGLFELGGLKCGQSVVILNASGGVGSFAVQMAKAIGCTVIIGTCSEEKRELVESLGATVVDYTKNQVVDDIRAALPGGAHLVFDCVGGDQSAVGVDILMTGGVIVSIVNQNISEQAQAAGKKGVHFLAKVSGSQLQEISELIDAGSLRVARVTDFPMLSWKAAFDLLESNKTAGKIVLTAAGPADLRLQAKADPRLLRLMTQLGMHKTASQAAVDSSTPRHELVDFFSKSEAGMEMLDAVFFPGPNSFPNVEEETVTITGVDSNNIDLFISTPVDVTGPMPCVYHIHGGGMCLSSAEQPYYARTRNRLAALGMVVIGVQFRNGAGRLGPHPFPAGLNDCMSGLEWANSQRSVRSLSKIIVCGESGGANLSCAVALKAKRDGKLAWIDGVYALAPYIYGMYGHGLSEEQKLPSLSENDGLFFSCRYLMLLASIYLPEGEKATDHPLAWPYWARQEDLAGLPPHVISVNELDLLYSEGVEYYRKLNSAGVSARCRTVHGTTHAGDLLFMNVLPDVFESTLHDIAVFATHLPTSCSPT